MEDSTTRRRPRAWKVWCSGLAILAIAVGISPAGATTHHSNATAPGAPTITSITAGQLGVKVTVTKPASDGGSRIRYYKASCTSSDGGAAGSSIGFATIWVGKLTVGKTYTCTVTAKNHVGYGPPSAPSGTAVPLPFVPPTAPGAPAITSVTAGPESIKVAFNKPASDGGSRIWDFLAACTSTDGGVAGSRHGHWSTITVHHLTAGKTYTCTVTAKNKVGSGPPSAPSLTAVPLVVVPPTAPGAPTITSVTAGPESIKVAFNKPASDGGSHIFDYLASCTSSNGGSAGSGHGFWTTIWVGHLTAGKTYTCTVTAKNKVGSGPPSAPSLTVVPLVSSHHHH